VLAPAAALATRLGLGALGLRTREVVLGDWRIRVHEGGAEGGEPWLLLHGLGATAATWLPFVRRERRRCRLLLPELSRLGGSRGPRAALSIADGARLVHQLLSDFVGERPATVAGISLGGWIAVRAARDSLERFARLLLVVPGGYRDQDWERIERMVRIGSYGESAAIWRALFATPPLWLRAARPLLYLAYRSPEVAAALASLAPEDAYGDADLAALDLPVGLVWGEEDRLFLAETGRRMAAALPHGRLWSLAGVGHALQWEHPEAFLEAIEAFRAAFPLPSVRPGAQDGSATTTGRR